jgi:hypothetical protein
MHNRQSGAAHVPMMFFLLLLVMSLGALGFAFVTQQKNGELTEERNKAQAELSIINKQKLLVEHYIEDVGRVIGKPGKYEGRQGSGGTYQGAVLTNPMVMNPDEIKKLIDDACASAGVSTSAGLENALGSMVTRVSQLGQRIKDIESERDKALAEKAEVDRKFQAATAEATSRATAWKQDLDQTRADFESAKQDKDRTITTLQEGLRSKADELTTVREAAAQTEKGLRGDVARHQMQNSALVARDAMRNPPDAPDGRILVAAQGVKSAFIDLGRKDLLQPGTVFRIRNPHSTAVKAYATVKSIEEERAEVELSGIVDPVADAVQAGDLLYNDLFTPRVARTIFLLGRFTAPYNKPELANLLKRLGNKVVDKMGPGVDTVILGNDPVNDAGDGFTAVADMPEYKEAVDLRVEFAYLKTIRDLLKL